MQNFLDIRLQSHGLANNPFKSPADMVRHYGCVQAQDLHQATRVVGSRTNDSTQEMVKQACRDGTIVRTRPMRGTLHYVAPEYVHRMLDICAVKTLPGFAKRREFLGISTEHAELALLLIESALKGGKSLTRGQILELLLKGGIPMQTQRVYHLTCYAATRKLICFGPPTEKEETFVLLDERVPHKKIHTLEQSYAELGRMYIRSHGPCTVDDLSRWCGLSKGGCKKAFELVKDEFETLDHNGKTYFYATNKDIKSPKGDLRLLGGFDEYFLGYKDRFIVADVEHHGKLFTKNGIFFPLVMLDGKIIGTWKRAIKKNSLHVHISIVEKNISIDKSQLNEQSRKFANFLGINDVEVALI